MLYYPNMNLDDVKKGCLFKMLSYKTLYEVGIEYQFDKKYKDAKAVKGAVYRVYQEVRKDPEKYFVAEDTLKTVEEAMASRLAVPTVRNGEIIDSKGTTLREKSDALSKQDIKDILVSGRNKAFTLINTKMDRIGSSRKKLDAVSIGELAKVFGILFDKAQIIQGEATEHVSIMSKISTDMSPKDALDTVLRMREITQADKHKD